MKIRTLTQKEFPAQLLEIPEPPEKLYLRGTLPNEDAPLLAVVGSRNYTSYGKDACEKIISGLRGSPVVIVSGLALGIDGIAHRAALDAGLQTIAVPGSGLNPNVLYPSSHAGLAEKILSSGGALLSEFEPDFKATPYAFPKRNRIMAGLSRGILVIEAAKNSGTQITARLGTEYNRDVFAVPGSIFGRNSEGSNILLKSGATPVTSGEDILSHWNMLQEESGGQNMRMEKLLESCSLEEKRVLELLSEPLSKDELIKKSNLPVEEVNVILSVMEIKGIIQEVSGEVRAVF